MNRKVYNAIYSILVNEAGANESGRECFIAVFMQDPPREYRFQGALGFGGKFWLDRYDVNCYREDEDDDRRRMIDKTNVLLGQLREEVTAGAFE